MILALFYQQSHSKTFGRCELAKELLYKYKLPRYQIASWVCLAHEQSRYNTRFRSHCHGEYGIFQISSKYWCSVHGTGKGCNMHCKDLLSDDLSKSVACAKKIYKEHQKISGNGFKAWDSYKVCKHPEMYVKGCF